MHLQEITFFDKVKVTWNVAQLPRHHVTYAPAKFDVAHPMVKEKIQENTLFDLDLGVKVTLNVAQYPQHHVTYAPAKFDIATYQGLGKDAFTRKYIFDLDLLGSRSQEMLPSALYIMWPMHLQSFKLLRQKV